MDIFGLFIDSLASLVSFYLHFEISNLSLFYRHLFFYLHLGHKSTSIYSLCQFLLNQVFALKR